jgi:hypothetical protein
MLTFTGRIDSRQDRVLKLGPIQLDRPEAFRQHLRSLDGQVVEVIVRPKQSQRSSEQNRYLWYANTIIAEHLGYDKHEKDLVHYALLQKCYGVRHDETLDVDVPARTSSQLTTKEFSEYMDWLVRYAAMELDIVLPLPGEADF